MHAGRTHIVSKPSYSDRFTLLFARVARYGKGIALTLGIAAVSGELGMLDVFQLHGVSSLTLAIVIGMVVGNTVYGRLAGQCEAGVGLSKQALLRAGIVLYGFRLTFQNIGHVGLAGIVIDALVLTSTFAMAIVLGTKVFGLERHEAILIGAGSSICGAAAVMAAAPVIRARSEHIALAVATVVVFGTAAIFLYPLMYRFNATWQLLPATPAHFGIYIGSTVHEVAQVVAAGRSIGHDAADAAVIAKLVRVIMLAPFLLMLSIWCKRRSAVVVDDAPAKLAIPWFAFAFIGVVGIHSLGWLPMRAIEHVNNIDTVMLGMAMAGLGLTTHVSAVRRAGIKPLLLGALLFAWLIAGGALLNRLVETLLS